jgi:hypothetical protein
MIDIALFLRELDALELAMAKFYQHFGAIFRDDPEAVRFFERMQREEGDHSNLIRFQLSIVSKNKSMNRPIAIDLAPVRKLTEHIERVVASGLTPDLTDVLRAAVALETDAAEHHYKTAIREIDEEFARLVRTLGGADTTHLRIVVEFAKQRGITLGSAR